MPRNRPANCVWKHGCETVKIEARGLCGRHYQFAQARDLLAEYPHYLVRRTDRDADGNKRCPKCQQWIQESFFTKHRSSPDGLTSWCRDCMSKGRRSSYYKLSESEVQNILSAQNYCCAICDTDIATNFVIDHDHNCCPKERSCGRCIRGALCRNCNTGLGMFAESIRNVRNASKYLEGYDAERS
jgi:hypothetical protein